MADWLKAVRAMEILGVLFIGGAGFCGFFKLFVAKNQDSFLKIAAATGIAAVGSCYMYCTSIMGLNCSLGLANGCERKL